MEQLTEGLVESILLRIPPDDPRTLLRAALVCKCWCRLVSGAGFRRRFCELHRSPPVLGFACFSARDRTTRFSPTAPFRGICADGPATSWLPLHALHGRFLIEDVESRLAVWDPITGDQRRLPAPPPPPYQSCVSRDAALLCAAAGCDHLDCCARGPFLVVLICTHCCCTSTSTRVYSSEAGAWTVAASVEHPYGCVWSGSCALVANSLYFFFHHPLRKEKDYQILEYNVASQDSSVITVLPPECLTCYPALITGEHGGLGLACVRDSKLHIWSREEAARGWEWVPRRAIDLNSFFPSDDALFDASAKIVLGYGVDMVFVLIAGVEVFNIRLKAGQATRISEISDNTDDIVPFSCFYTPRITLAEPSTSDELAGASQT